MVVLAQLPEAVRRDHLHLIHIGGASAKQAEDEHGMTVAKPGVENTIRLDVPESRNALAIDILGTAQAIDLFRNFSINQCIQCLESVEVEFYEPDAVIVDNGRGLKENFYLIMNGVATVSTESGYSRPVRRGDYFCELLNEAYDEHDHATPTIKAITGLTVIRLEKFAFHRFLSQDARLRAASPSEMAGALIDTMTYWGVVGLRQARVHRRVVLPQVRLRPRLRDVVQGLGELKTV